MKKNNILFFDWDAGRARAFRLATANSILTKKTLAGQFVAGRGLMHVLSRFRLVRVCWLIRVPPNMGSAPSIHRERFIISDNPRCHCPYYL